MRSCHFLPKLATMRHTGPTTNGHAIRAIRGALGWKLGNFAAAVGVSESYMSRVENGHRQPAPEIRVRIAAVLGVKLAAITGGQPFQEAA